MEINMAVKPDVWVTPASLQQPLANAYHDWKHIWPADGKKFLWFEHHAEIVLGIKCTVNYDNRQINVEHVLDEEKYLLFMIKYA